MKQFVEDLRVFSWIPQNAMEVYLFQMKVSVSSIEYTVLLWVLHVLDFIFLNKYVS